MMTKSCGGIEVGKIPDLPLMEAVVVRNKNTGRDLADMVRKGRVWAGNASYAGQVVCQKGHRLGKPLCSGQSLRWHICCCMHTYSGSH
eukprot:1161918-Pelagomonas_calceolata.AAC.8